MVLFVMVNVIFAYIGCFIFGNFSPNWNTLPTSFLTCLSLLITLYDPSDDIDNLARAEWAQRMICRVLLEAERNSDIPLLDMIAAEAPDIDGSNGLSYLLEMATWRPAKEES